ncbi:MAG TPA: PRC and DUF2382 domain-containing protein [Micromonosporaceae bacterium]
MISQETVATLYGSEVYDRNDEKVGTIGQVYAAEETRQPAWVSVRTGMLGQRESLVPIEGAQWEGDRRLRVPYDKAQIKAAPHVDSGDNRPIESDDLARLYQHYDLQPMQARRPAEETRQPSAEEAVTVSEERMHVGTERQEVGKARLHKYVVTEPVQTTVPVSHEEVRLEREPIEPGVERPSPSEIGEAEREVVLHAERPVVAKETVPVERVRLDVDTVTDQENVGAELRKEHVEADVPRRS